MTAMKQDERMQAIVARVERHMPVEPIALDPELSSADSFLKILRVKCYNWRTPQLDKFNALRFTVNFPSLDALTMIFYPRPALDAPIFLCFMLLTNRKTVFHLNAYTPFEEPDYQADWIAPLSETLERYPPFDVRDRYPDWMSRYRRDCTLYGLFMKDRLDDLNALIFDYLDIYLPKLAAAEDVTDPERLARIRTFHENFRTDIRTRDKAQGMMSKFIGKERARRIFYEATT